MENYKKDYEGRRDYGQSSEKRYSSEGRVLRPRKREADSGNEEHREHRAYSEHRSYTGHKSYGERRSFTGGRPEGERRSFNGGHKPQGEGRPYGERRSSGEGRPQYGERRSFGSDRSRTQGEGRPYGERRTSGEGRPFGERRSFGADRRPQGEGRPYGERRSFEGRRQHTDRPGRPFAGGRNNFHKKFEFEDKEEGGINKMLSRKPQINGENYSGEISEIPIKDEMRLNKFIANSGVCSRREADTFIEAGVVTVNGEVVTELGTKVNIHNDDVRFNGERLKGEQKVYIVMNKPKGYVTTASDPHAEKTVMELLKGCDARVFPVGRLDKATTGVLMFTNDGEVAEKLTHPSYDKKKIYQVMLDNELNKEDFDRILSGITLVDGDIKADELEFIDENDHRKLGIEIHSGKNRIVRRIFDSLGYEVKALDRVYFAGLTKKGLKKGEWRYLTESEINILKMGAYI